MSLESLGESDIGEGDTPPGEETGGGGKVGKVAEDGTSGRLERHVGESGKEGAEDQGDPWETSGAGSRKDLGGLSGKSKTVKSSGRGVEIRRSGGPCGRQETSVDNGGKDGDTGVSDSNDPWGLGDTGRETEGWVVRRDNDTNDESTTQVEDDDTDEDALDGSGKVSAGVLGLGGGNGDNFSSNVGESGLGEDGEETEESTEISRNVGELVERSWVLPVLETDDLAFGSTTGRDDDTEDNETDNGNDLDTGEP